MKVINKFLQESKQSILYCDMDGVLCDWEAQFTKYARMSPDDYTEKYGDAGLWKLVNNIGVKFWSTIPWMQDGKQLWNYIKGKNPIILTKPALHHTSVTGKKIWIKQELGIRQPYIIEREKVKYAKGNILIDDQENNIIPWRKAGGIGILHISSAKTIQKLRIL